MRAVTAALIRRIKFHTSLQRATGGHQLSLVAYVTMTLDRPIPSERSFSRLRYSMSPFVIDYS